MADPADAIAAAERDRRGQDRRLGRLPRSSSSPRSRCPSSVAGLVIAGKGDLPGLTGTLLSNGHAFRLVAVSWAAALPAALAWTAFALFLSARTRNSVVGIAVTGARRRRAAGLLARRRPAADPRGAAVRGAGRLARALRVAQPCRRRSSARCWSRLGWTAVAVLALALGSAGATRWRHEGAGRLRAASRARSCSVSWPSPAARRRASPPTA